MPNPLFNPAHFDAFDQVPLRHEEQDERRDRRDHGRRQHHVPRRKVASAHEMRQRLLNDPQVFVLRNDQRPQVSVPVRQEKSDRKRSIFY